MRNKVLFIFGIIILLVLPLVISESIGTFKQNSCVELIQTCADCTYINISSVFYPNSTKALEETAMQKTGTFYNYSFCNTVALGVYNVNGHGDEESTDTVWAYDFEINAIGFESTTSRSEASTRGIYFIFGLAVIFFIGFLFFKTEIVALKWTFFILFILFCVIGINMISISMYNEIGNTQLGAIFDQLAAGSYIFYWFIGGILLIMWVLTMVASLADKQRMKQAESIGQVNYDFTK